jgi:hypothetical protein
VFYFPEQGFVIKIGQSIKAGRTQKFVIWPFRKNSDKNQINNTLRGTPEMVDNKSMFQKDFRLVLFGIFCHNVSQA